VITVLTLLAITLGESGLINLKRNFVPGAAASSSNIFISDCKYPKQQLAVSLKQ